MRETEKIWMNGELVDWADATVHVGTHGLHYGTGVFEGIRCYETDKGPAVFRLTDHLVRLAQLGEAAVHGPAVLGRGPPRRVHGADRRERPSGVLPASDRVLGLRRARRLDRGQSGRRRDHELALGRVPRRRGPEERDPREDLLLAARRAEHDPARVQGDRDLPELDARGDRGEPRRLRRGDPAHRRTGFIADGSGENVFIVKDGTIATPPLATSILPGITRDSLIQIAQDIGYTVEEKNLIRSDLVTADEIFMTGTAAEVTPIREVDDR